MSEGHTDAPDYPIAFVWEEIQLVVDRKNRMLASEATVMHAAINTAVAAFGKDGGSKAHAAFQKLIKNLIGSDDPDPPPAPAKRRQRGS